MVMFIPQRGSPEDYPEERIGQPDETSEVELTSTPPREELRKLPKTVLLRVAIELDPDKVAESYQEGWTKDDILRIIERHIKSELGKVGTYGGEYILEVDIIDSEVDEE